MPEPHVSRLTHPRGARGVDAVERADDAHAEEGTYEEERRDDDAQRARVLPVGRPTADAYCAWSSSIVIDVK
ncbi:hypothetical protein P8631_18900, partial [Guyparkeria sp. 1SP6A2]|nr:hypothetical protein [Guyparkeria sp. 1SP6A2]